MAEVRVTICGVGALGANIAENLARCGVVSFILIDRDRVEERNLSTQPYYRSDIGSFKAKAMANALYRALGVKASDLIVDAFDNSASRGLVKGYCEDSKIACLHAGMSSDYGEVIWNERYRVPSPVNEDVCDYPLARNLVMLTAVVATEALIGYITRDERRSCTITAADMRVMEY